MQDSQNIGLTYDAKAAKNDFFAFSLKVKIFAYKILVFRVFN